MTKQEMITVAVQTAKAHSVDPALLCAMAEHESGGWETFAVRFEPAFLERWVPKAITEPTERTARAFSYGLLQLMGQTAREFGFTGPYLTQLCDPYVGLEFGCRKLKHCLEVVGGDVRKALLMYNGGANPNYPDLVLQHLPAYQGVAA